jgi:hypothetical protein
MLVLGFGIESVSGICAYLPFGTLAIVEPIVDLIVGAFGGLLSEAIYDGHFLGDKLFGLCVSRGCSECEMRS